MNGLKVTIIQVEHPSPATTEVNKSVDCRGTGAKGQKVACIGEEFSASIRETVIIHLIDGPTLGVAADLLRWILRGAAASAPASTKGKNHLPFSP